MIQILTCASYILYYRVVNTYLCGMIHTVHVHMYEDLYTSIGVFLLTLSILEYAHSPNTKPIRNDVTITWRHTPKAHSRAFPYSGTIASVNRSVRSTIPILSSQSLIHILISNMKVTGIYPLTWQDGQYQNKLSVVYIYITVNPGCRFFQLRTRQCQI